MYKIACLLTAFALVAAIPALAQDPIHGTIRSVDATNHTVILDNGQTVQIGPSTDTNLLKKGAAIDETCSGSTMDQCTNVEPERHPPAATEILTENNTLPAATQ